jgi:hypothetical protein
VFRGEKEYDPQKVQDMLGVTPMQAGPLIPYTPYPLYPTPPNPNPLYPIELRVSRGEGICPSEGARHAGGDPYAGRTGGTGTTATTGHGRR